MDLPNRDTKKWTEVLTLPYTLQNLKKILMAPSLLMHTTVNFRGHITHLTHENNGFVKEV